MNQAILFGVIGNSRKAGILITLPLAPLLLQSNNSGTISGNAAPPAQSGVRADIHPTESR